MEWPEEQAKYTIREGSPLPHIISSLIGGGLVMTSFMRGARRSWFGNLLAGGGAALMYQGVTASCREYHAMRAGRFQETATSQIGRRKVDPDQAIRIQQSILIERAAPDLYQFWRNLENLPKIMSHLHSVQVINDQLSHWTVKTIPGGPTIEWDAEIINEVPNERIGWRSLQGADVDNTGSVVFEAMPDAGVTWVTVTLQYIPPAGRLGSAIATVLGQNPVLKIAQDLQRFKERMETHAWKP